MNRKEIIQVICSFSVAVCFGIVSYGQFNSGERDLGILFAIISVIQVVSGIVNIQKKKD